MAASSGAIRAGQAFVEIFATDSKFQQSMTRVRTTLKEVGTQVKRAGTGMFMSGAALGAPIALAVRQFAGFDDAIRASAAAAGKGEGDIGRMGAAAEKLALQFGMATTDVAKLGVEVSRAFGDTLSTEQINEVTASVIAMSKATGTDGVQSASIMASTLAQFGMQASEASRVADVLTFTANATLNSVESLGEALKYAGTNAAGAGMDIEQTAAILGTLGNLGVQGSDAGTALKRMLVITGAEAEKLKGIFGVSFLDMNGNVRPLVETLGEVAEVTNKMAGGERMAKMNEAFGLLGISAAAGIGRASQSTAELEQRLRTVAGTASNQAAFMEAGVGGSMRSLSTQIGVLGNAFAAALVPAIQSASQTASGLASYLTRLTQESPALAQAIAGTSVALVAGGAAAIALGSALQGLSVIIGVTQKAMMLFAANPAVVGGLAVAAVAIGGIGLALRQLWPDFKNTTDEYLKMIGIMSGGGGPDANKPLEARDIAPKLSPRRQDELRQVVEQSKSPLFQGMDTAKAFRRIVGEEMAAVGGDKTLPKDARNKRLFELSQIASTLDQQMRASAATPAAAAAEPTERPKVPPAPLGATPEQKAEAERVRLANRTPQQRLNDERNNLLSLFESNALSEADFLTALDRIEKEAASELERGQTKTREPRLAGTPEAAVSASAGISSAGTFGDATMLGIGPELADPARETAENTAIMADELARIGGGAGLAAEVAGPRAADVRQAVGAGAQAAGETATLSQVLATTTAQMVEAIGRTTSAVESAVGVLKEIAGNTAELGGVFL